MLLFRRKFLFLIFLACITVNSVLCGETDDVSAKNEKLDSPSAEVAEEVKEKPSLFSFPASKTKTNTQFTIKKWQFCAKKKNVKVFFLGLVINFTFYLQVGTLSGNYFCANFLENHGVPFSRQSAKMGKKVFLRLKENFAIGKMLQQHQYHPQSISG